VTEPPRTTDRVVAAALRCLARTGLRAMTVDDVAVDAGVSRATLYRAFPGGRDTILSAVVDAELARLLAAVGQATEPATELREALVAGLHAAAAWLRDHEVIERLMFDEPATLLTHLEFEQMDRTLAVVSARLAPLLAPFVGDDLAERAGEWTTRVALSYLLFPADEVDLGEVGDVGWLVDRYVLPGVAAAGPPAVRDRETVSAKLS
jgi:AcrR family transcriptional regulator